MFALLFLIRFLFYIPLIIAIPGRVLQGCTVLGDDAFCYGGYIAASGGVFKNPSNGHFSIDLSTLDLTKTLVTPQWKPLERTDNSPPFEPRAALQMVPLDVHRYVMLGGGHNNPLNNSAVIYDKTTNVWTSLTPPPYYMAEGDIVGSGNTIWAYGGKLNSTSTYTPNNLLKMDISTSAVQWTVVPMRQGGPTIGRYGHSQTLRNNIIYFFGGFLNLPEENLKPNIVPFSRITWYNTQTDQWGHVPTNGNIPSSRKYLTSTLIPNSSQILLYGGTDTANLQALPVADYCYIYDSDKHKYTVINFANNVGAGPRIGHSAIAYQNSILILMGYDRGGNILSDTHVLNVSVPERPEWAGRSELPSDPISDDDTGNNGLGIGAIVGIVIGCVAFIAIVGAFLFVWYRKRKQRKNENDYYIPPPQDFHVDIPPTMFAENDDHQMNKDNNNNLNHSEHYHRAHSTDYATDPVPTYPIVKPYDDHTRPQIPRIKPSE